MAAELILHHYDFSSYSEKVRLVLGLKGLTWRSVDIPPVLPKPDYMPLTGGYRGHRRSRSGPMSFVTRNGSSKNSSGGFPSRRSTLDPMEQPSALLWPVWNTGPTPS
jgi:hypothetical protein